MSRVILDIYSAIAGLRERGDVSLNQSLDVSKSPSQQNADILSSILLFAYNSTVPYLTSLQVIVKMYFNSLSHTLKRGDVICLFHLFMDLQFGLCFR